MPNSDKLLTEEQVATMESEGQITPVESAPIIPGLSNPPVATGRDQYSSGPLSPNLGLSPELVKTGYGGGVAEFRLMPVLNPPQQGAAVQSQTSPIVGNLGAQTKANTIANQENSTLIAGNSVAIAVNSNLIVKGSDSPTFSGSFGYTSTTTTVTWTWHGLVLYWSDGTSTAISDGSQLITGLIKSTTYYFYPYYDTVSGTLKWIGSIDLVQPFPSIVGVLGDGSTGYLSTATSIVYPTSYSVEFLFRQSSTGAADLVEFNQTQLGSPGSTLGAAIFMTTAAGGTLSYYVTSSHNVNGSTTNLANGQWHYVVMTYDGTTVNSYVDGVLDASMALVAPAGFNGFWRAFNGGVLNANFFNGVLSNIAVYNSVLTLAQVGVHYNVLSNSGQAALSAAAVTDGAVHLWSLTETSGTTAADSIGTDTGTYNPTLTLAQSQAFVASIGTPAIAWPFPTSQAGQAQNLNKPLHIPFSAGSMTAATTASGSGGGSGGGSQGVNGLCLSPDTLIKTKQGDKAFIDLQIGDEVLTAKGTWRKVLRLVEHYYDGPVYPSSGGFITPTHSLLRGAEWVMAKECMQSWVPYAGLVYNAEIETAPKDDPNSSYTEHSYTLANGTVCHNIPFHK